VDNKKPYKEITHENCVIRIFDSECDPEELKWHRDHEDRTVIPLNENDWHYQEDNKLPIPIDSKIFIPTGLWHRVIKGSTKLVVMIEKNKPA
jgi:hypothetical protein